MWPLRIVPSKESLFTRCLCDLYESSQIKGRFTKVTYRHLVNKWPFTWDDSQGYHWYFVSKGPFTWDDSLRSHIDTLWTKDPLLGTIRKGRIDTLWTRTLYLGRFSKVTYRHLVNKGPFTWYGYPCESSQVKDLCSQGVYVTFENRPK
jgi:hypothetical protein